MPEIADYLYNTQEHMFAEENAFPFGRNEQSVVKNYYERQKYRYGTYFKNLPKPIDTLYDKVYYGKVDRFQNTIVPKKQSAYIKQVSYEQNVFAFDFVADAFFKLQRNLKIAGDSGGIETEQSVLYDIQPQRAWFNYERPYVAFLDPLFRMYNTYLQSLDKKDFNKIITFEDYLSTLMNFLRTGQYQRPISLTEYVLSRATSPNVSGLVIEISQDSYSDDANKFQKYFLDPNFSYFVRAARKFGFYVDKNGPWRLVADVFSPPMLEDLLVADRITGDIERNFFDTYYTRTYTLDLPYLQQRLLVEFNNFAETNHIIRESVAGLSYLGAGNGGVGNVACGPAHTNIIGYRSPQPAEIIDSLGDPYWLDFYFNLRMIESGVHYTNSSFLIDESVRVSSAYDYNRALIYINNLFKPYLYDERLFKKRLTGESATVRIGSVVDGPRAIVGGNY